MSDIAGQDIQTHGNTQEEIVKVIRNWLRTASRLQTIPSGSIIWERYRKFLQDLPKTAQMHRLIVEEMVFNDYTLVIEEWLKVTSD